MPLRDMLVDGRPNTVRGFAVDRTAVEVAVGVHELGVFVVHHCALVEERRESRSRTWCIEGFVAEKRLGEEGRRPAPSRLYKTRLGAIHKRQRRTR